MRLYETKKDQVWSRYPWVLSKILNRDFFTFGSRLGFFVLTSVVNIFQVSSVQVRRFEGLAEVPGVVLAEGHPRGHREEGREPDLNCPEICCECPEADSLKRNVQELQRQVIKAWVHK